jgi:RNA polymerase sigma-70 factor, ECF subfamily
VNVEAPQSTVALEEELVHRGIKGDSQALEILFARYEHTLYRNALRLLGNEDDALDALQDGMLLAYQNLHRFEGRSRFSTWLTRIVINSALMRMRKMRAHEVVSIDAENGSEEMTLADQLQDPRPNPESVFMENELCEVLENNLRTLSPDLRAALILRHGEEKSTEEVAKDLGIGENTLKSRVRRARLQIANREALAAYLHREPGFADSRVARS